MDFWKTFTMVVFAIGVPVIIGFAVREFLRDLRRQEPKKTPSEKQLADINALADRNVCPYCRHSHTLERHPGPNIMECTSCGEGWKFDKKGKVVDVIPNFKPDVRLHYQARDRNHVRQRHA